MDLSLYCITCDLPSRGCSHLDVARAAIEGGATVVQFREKRLSGDALVDAARPVRRLCAEHGVPFIMNDDASAALALDADGLHVGQDEIEELDIWREGLARGSADGPTSFEIAERICGISINDPCQVGEAGRLGADYLGVGPVFATPSKEDAGPPLGLDGLRRVRDMTTLPIVAIGGIDGGLVGEVLTAGADGVCVISAIAAANDMVAAARALRCVIDTHRETVTSR